MIHYTKFPKNSEEMDEEHPPMTLKLARKLYGGKNIKTKSKNKSIRVPVEDGITLDEFWKSQGMSEHIWGVESLTNKNNTKGTISMIVPDIPNAKNPEAEIIYQR